MRLELSVRQVKRLWQRFEADGDAELVYNLRGKPALRERILARYGEAYAEVFCRVPIPTQPVQLSTSAYLTFAKQFIRIRANRW